MSRPLPEWSTSRPEKSGVYVGFSDDPRRTDGADLYHYDAKEDLFQHHSGFYDHKVTHWILIKADD